MLTFTKMLEIMQNVKKWSWWMLHSKMYVISDMKFTWSRFYCESRHSKTLKISDPELLACK